MRRSIAADGHIQVQEWRLKVYHIRPKEQGSIDQAELTEGIVAAIYDQILHALGSEDPWQLFLGYIIIHCGKNDDYVTVGRVGEDGEMMTTSWTKKKGPDAPFRVVTREEPGMCLWEAQVHGHVAAAFISYIADSPEPWVEEFLEIPFEEQIV